MYLDRYLVIASVAAKSITVYDLEPDKPLAILKDVPQSYLMEAVNKRCNCAAKSIRAILWNEII